MDNTYNYWISLWSRWKYKNIKKYDCNFRKETKELTIISNNKNIKSSANNKMVILKITV